MNRVSFHLLIVLIVGLAVYSNTFDVPFQFDDFGNISENPVIGDLLNFISSAKGYDYNPRRYIGYLTFALNYHFGRLDVSGYHVVNLAVHILNAMLVYFLVLLTFRTPYFSDQRSAISPQQSTVRSKKSVVSSKKEEAIYDSRFTSSYSPFMIHDSRSFIAFFAALLFVSHPIQTQAVTYIVQRFTSLATLFYLLSVVMYIKGRLITQRTAISNQQSAEESKKEEKETGNSLLTTHYSLFTIHCSQSKISVIFYLLSLISAVLAMKTKETAFTLPVVILLYEFTFFRSSLKKKLLFLIPVLLTLAIIPASIMHTDKPLGEILSDLSEKTRVQTNIPRFDYLMTEMRVIVTYIRLLFLPINQNLDYDYPIYNSFLTPPVFISFLFLSAIFGTAGYLLYKSRREAMGNGLREKAISDDNSPHPPLKLRGGAEGGGVSFTIHDSRFTIYRLAAFGILWFFITLSVESSFIPIMDVIFEHRVYLPSAGAFIALAAAVFAVARKVGRPRMPAEIIFIPLAVIIFTLSAVTYARNSIWKDGVTLWKDVIKKAPGNARAHNNLGFIYYEKGMLDLAGEQFITGLRLRPEYSDARVNLGIVYNAEGMIDQAIEQYMRVLSVNPNDADAHNNLGIAYVSKGMVDQGVAHYQIALRINPDYPEAYNNLGVVYGTKGMLDQAIAYFRHALQLKPDYFEAHYNLARAFLKKNDARNADEVYRRLLRTNPEAAKRLLALLREGDDH